MSMKNTLTPAGIEPATFRFVAQHLNRPYSDKIFKIKKRVIRIITNSRMRDSCRELLKKLEILPLYSQYIFSISVFVIKNEHLL